MEQTPIPKKRTMRGIVWGQFLSNIENSTLKQNIQSCFRLMACLGITYFLVYPEKIQEVLIWTATVGNFATPKFLGVYILLNFWRPLRTQIKRFFRKPTTLSIEGIPQVELLDHLFREQSFKRDDIKAKFCIPHHRYQALARKLESLGILVRGDNNSRVLNPEYSRQDIAAILQGKRKANDLEDVLKEVEGGLSSEPMQSVIEERVREYLSTPPEFTVKSL